MHLKNILTACCVLTILAAASPAAAADNITLNIKNGDVKEVLRAVSKLAGVSIVTDDNVRGRIDLQLQDVPFTNALDIITSTRGLSYRKVNDIILVSSVDNMAKTNNTVASYKLSYARAKDVSEPLSAMFGTGKIAVDTVTNSILFTGTGSEEARLRSALSVLDVATHQITLEAKIIAVNEEASRSLGVNWEWDKIPRRGDNYSDSDDDSSSYYDGNFKFWRGYAFRFNATLNALVANGKAKILATPRIITIPGREASIFIGDHIPVQTEKHDSSGSYTSTEYLDAGIKLAYTPIISADGKMVTASVHTEVSTPTLISDLRNYKITSRTADTNVRMLSGETLVIGGLISEEEQRNLQRVPLLSNIPLIGELFKSRTKRKTKTEVIMLLTPYITEAGASPAIYNRLDMDTNKESKVEKTISANKSSTQN